MNDKDKKEFLDAGFSESDIRAIDCINENMTKLFYQINQSHKKTMKTEQETVSLQTLWMTIGMAAGLETFSRNLFTEAGKLFALGKDVEAKIVRNIAQNADHEAQLHRKKQKDYEAECAKHDSASSFESK